MHKGVILKDNVVIGDFAIIGHPCVQPDAETTIGNDSIIRSHTIIYAGTRIGSNFQSGHGALVRENVKIGDNVSVGSHAEVCHNVIIEDGVRLHSKVFVPEFSHIERGAWIGPAVVLTNAKYPQSSNVKNNLVGPHIGRDAIIGANVTILPGLKIGENAIIGAGAVVTKDVPAGVVIVGPGARTINHRGKITDYEGDFDGG